MNHYNDGGGHIESSNIYDEVARFDSMDDTQIDMIYHPDDKAIFYSIPVNQNDSFLSLFLLFFQTIIF